MLERCKYLGREKVRVTCCSKKSTYECERLELDVVPLDNCEECRFFNTMIDTANDVMLDRGLQAVFDLVKHDEGYETGYGDGIIYVGEGKYWPGIVVGIHMLRRSGCTLPIEVWYRGKSGDINTDDVRHIDKVKFIDLDVMSNALGDSKIPQGNPRSGGWEAKLYAMMHTKFDRVLYLDADAYCVKDPTCLFDLLDKHTFVYWRDLPTQIRSIKWANVYPPGLKLTLPPIQGGQLLVDRNYGWRLVHLAHYMCQNSHHYFRYMYGDQDAWRVALAMEHRVRYDVPRLYKCLGIARWQHPAFICGYDPKVQRVDDSKPMVVHRCQGKLYRLKDIPRGRVKYSNPQYFLPREEEVFNIFAQVINSEKQVAHHTFGNIYAQQLWGGGSGRGSETREAQAYVDMVNFLIQKYKWEKVIDCGSGDGNIASRLNAKEYVGYDCCFDIVRESQRKFGFCTFVHLDFYKQLDIIQSGDVLLCKDVLHHWPNEWVTDWLTRLTESKKWRVILFTQDRDQLSDEQECHLGGYRALDYKRPPLNRFPLQKIASIYHKDMLMWVQNG